MEVNANPDGAVPCGLERMRTKGTAMGPKAGTYCAPARDWAGGISLQEGGRIEKQKIESRQKIITKK